MLSHPAGSVVSDHSRRLELACRTSMNVSLALADRYGHDIVLCCLSKHIRQASAALNLLMSFLVSGFTVDPGDGGTVGVA